MSAADQAAFNAMIAAGTKDAAACALTFLSKLYKAANGSAPAVRVTGTGLAPTSSGFESQAQAVAAMQDPRYQKDPAYGDQVARKLMNKTY